MTAGVVAGSLTATVATTVIAAQMDALGLLLVVMLAGAGLAIAIVRPELLFPVYCAAIPFNFALPPGPAGTMARIAGVIFFVGYLLRRPASLHPTTIPLVGWAFIGWMLVSCLWAVDTGAAFQAWISLAQLFAITVLISSMVSEHPALIRTALWGYGISATGTAVIAGFQYLQGAAVFGRATAFADQDPALFASLVLPAAIFLMAEVQSRATGILVRAVAVACLTICVVALALSGTRSAWVGIVVATGVWLIIQRDPRQILAIAALSSGVAVLVASVPGIGDFLFGRIGLSLATGGSGRTDIWIVGLSILASAPLLGVGLGNFGMAFTSYAISQASGASGAGGALFAGRGAHNVLLATAVETGVIGGVLLVAFSGVALARSIDDRGNVVRMALISLYVQAMFLDILQQKQLWLFLALAFGLAASQRVDRARGGQRSDPVGYRGVPTAPLA
jgi:exopolysaccharide production protein ExoQ